MTAVSLVKCFEILGAQFLMISEYWAWIAAKNSVYLSMQESKGLGLSTVVNDRVDGPCFAV